MRQIRVGTKATRFGLATAVIAAGFVLPTTAAKAATVDCDDPMVLVFDGSISRQAAVRLAASSPGVTIDWGGSGTSTPAGTATSPTSRLRQYPASPGDINFTYKSGGSHTVRICGAVQHFGADPANRDVDYRNTSLKALTKVRSFGSLGVESFAYAFAGARNLSKVPTRLPATVTDLSHMFSGAKRFNYPIGRWNTSKVTDMSNMFEDASRFNRSLHAWDTGRVTTMAGMFRGASRFNRDIGNWDTSHVTNLSGMFSDANAFNQPLGRWDTSRVRDLSYMFSSAQPSAFNQTIQSWDTSNVVTMEGMFAGATSFNRSLDAWDTGQVTTMRGMFTNAAGFNQSIGGWDTSDVVDLSRMFAGAAAFNQDLSGWDTSSVENLSATFQQARRFNQDLSDWDTAKVLSLSKMFNGAIRFNQDIGGWNTGNVRALNGVFEDAISFDQDLSAWDITRAESMGQLFDDSGLSPANYDAILNGWGAQTVGFGVSLGAGRVRYSESGTAARDGLIDEFQWQIHDGGPVIGGQLSPTSRPAFADETPKARQLLRGTVGNWGPCGVKLKYQWYRKSKAGKTTAISGATGRTYRVRTSDVRYRLQLRVTGTMPGHQRVTEASKWTDRVTKK